MTQRYRYLQLLEWEVCAACSAGFQPAPGAPGAAGKMPAVQFCQKRVPAALFHHVPRPGALIWVQEPFVHLEGRGRDEYFELTLYRADAGPSGGFPPQPPETRHRHVRTHVYEAREMKQSESRLTLEVTRAWLRPWSYFEIGDREREGLLWLKQAAPHLKLQDAWSQFWQRTYPPSEGGSSERSERGEGTRCSRVPAGGSSSALDPPPENSAPRNLSASPQGPQGGGGEPVLMLRFRVHRMNISELLRQRSAAA